MERYLRQWRTDAASRNQYETAIFVGDKLLALTDKDADAIELARLYFSNANYTRALSVLTRRDLVLKDPECQYLAAHCHVKSGRTDRALDVLGDKTPSYILAAAGSDRRKIQKTGRSNTVRPLHNGATAATHPSAEEDAERRAEIGERKRVNRLYAGMAYLRGLCYSKHNAFDRAKACYKDAVTIDVQCYEAFDQLMKNSLMSPAEERQFVDSLNFDSVSADGDVSTSQEAAQLTNLLYQTRCSKYFKTFGDSNEHAIETLATHYKLASNPDLLLAKAELLFVQCRFRDALAMTEAILQDDRSNFEALPVHLACLHELNERNALFLLSHELAAEHPDEPAAWLCVGVYYLTIGKIAEARRMFSKASMMDPHYGPAWIGFAHTFAAEGEHDQAIAAYTTSARLFQGTHLPQMFLGMQNLQLLNITLAREYLGAADAICPDDPLLLNERGVIKYYDKDFGGAAELFEQSLRNAVNVGAAPRSWVSTKINLGHAYRRLARLEEAIEQYDAVLRQGGRDVGVFCAKALVLMELDQPGKATFALHEALDINPQDAIANELLNKALDEQIALGARGTSPFTEHDFTLELALEERKESASRFVLNRSRRTAGASASAPTRPGASMNDE